MWEIRGENWDIEVRNQIEEERISFQKSNILTSDSITSHFSPPEF